MQYMFLFVKSISLRKSTSQTSMGRHQNHLEGFLLKQITASPHACLPHS